jgi:membrane protein DedA with SNARE-associated domain
MENKNISSFLFGTIAVILGWTLVKHFDFENLRFEKTWLDVLYLVVFVFSIYSLIKNNKKGAEK